MNHMGRLLLAVVPLLGCTSVATQSTTLVCELSGSFTATDCAVLQMAARDGNGNIAGFLPIRVDSVVPGIGQAYVSAATQTAGDGGFTLLVFRVSRFEQPDAPDTATVYVKGYAAANPPLGAAAVSRAAVRMRFVPIGDQVPPTTGVATFTPMP